MFILNNQLNDVLGAYNDFKSNEISEARAWDICHNEFDKAFAKDDCKNEDNLALHLGMYLANWGMYRASFVRSYNYREYIPVIQIIFDKKYKALSDLNITDYTDKNKGDDNINLLMDISMDLREYFLPLRNRVRQDVNSDISQTLITKILLATLGCTPAYDQYFCNGIKKAGIATGIFNERSIKQLSIFYKKYCHELEGCRKKLCNLENKQKEYPQAKLLDMLFFGFGYNN